MNTPAPHASTLPLAVVILAAGMGSRMKSNTPKVMHKLAGLPMINHLLQTVETLEPEKIIVVTGPDMPELKAAAAPHQTALQAERNGTAGALMAAMPQLKGFTGDVLVLLGDTPLLTAKTIRTLIQTRHQNADASTPHALSILGCIMENNTGYGRLIMKDNGLLEKIVEEKDANDTERAVTLVNTGALCFDGAHLPAWLARVDSNNAQNELYITQVPEIVNTSPEYAQAGVAVATINDPQEIRGCNTKADLAALEKTLQSRLRTYMLERGVTMLDPDSVYLSHDTKIGAGTLIEPHAFFGPGVTIAQDATIKAFSHIEHTTIAARATIGPFARLRPGTELAEDVRIGNFVEVKKSTIGKGSKINHLAYVGDCTMDEHVNFSAGAITVNYDGFDKFQTHIGKNVMIGSNANLVAPVTIEDGAFVAAGSTITKDVPADALSITREKMKILTGWAKKHREKKGER